MDKLRSKGKNLLESMIKHKSYLLMLMPGFALLVVFKYVPMGGIILAFKDHKLMLGVLGSPWVGFKNFEYLFTSAEFFRIMRNTLAISMLKLICGFPIPILFVLLLNELNNIKFKKIVQTTSYLPHFVSWVVLSALFIDLLSLDGPINGINKLLGLQPVIYMSRSEYFWFIVTGTHIWKTFGWSSILYFASLSNVDPMLYEAATIDGAGRLRRAVSISLPCIMPTIVILLILNTGSILDAGFDQILNMYNASVMDVADILDTYVYRQGLIRMEYSYSTAVGLFKSVVALAMVLTTNRIAKFIDRESVLW